MAKLFQMEQDFAWKFYKGKAYLTPKSKEARVNRNYGMRHNAWTYSTKYYQIFSVW